MNINYDVMQENFGAMQDEDRATAVMLELFHSREELLAKVRYMMAGPYSNAVASLAPHKYVADMPVVYSMVVKESQIGRSYAIVNDAVLQHLGITRGELDRAATRNLLEEEFTIRTMFEALTGIIPDFEADEDEKNAADDLLVISCKDGVLGAIAILRTDVLDIVSERMGGDFYILPSSRHEVLATKTSADPDELRAMVRAINQAEVTDKDRLSDNVYLYDSTQHRIRVA